MLLRQQQGQQLVQPLLLLLVVYCLPGCLLG
jgi:hypothetical protein